MISPERPRVSSTVAIIRNSGIGDAHSMDKFLESIQVAGLLSPWEEFIETQAIRENGSTSASVD
jgi:hypothetical protein